MRASSRRLLRFGRAGREGLSRRGRPGFTLMELLVVIAIVGILTAAALPAIKNISKADAMAAADRQLQDDVAYARRLAIRNRTTVYMVFLPPNYHGLQGAISSLSAEDQEQAQDLLGMQYAGYAMFSFRRVGDQPGQSTPVYLRDWSALPQGIYIPAWKFSGGITGVDPFQYVALPFPSATSPKVNLPCLAFNYLGQLVRFDAAGNPLSVSQDESIPLTRGAVLAPKDEATGQYEWQPAQIIENPPGASISLSNHVRVDWMTGRTKIIRPGIQ